MTIRPRHRAVALLLALACSMPALARPPMHFERLGLDDGLSQLAVNAVAQDKDGFLWVGTEEGLDRFDGYGFRHFRHDRHRPNSLTNDFIGDIEVDPNGVLWVATDGGGVVRRDADGENFTPLPGTGLKSSQRVRVLRFDADGRLWIGSRDAGLGVFDPRSRKTSWFRHDEANGASLSADSVFALLVTRRGTLWIGTETGVDRLDLATGAIRRIDLGRGAQRVRSLLEDRQGMIWVGAAGGLARVDAASGAANWFSAEFPRVQVNALLEDRAQRIWVATDGGLARVNRKDGSFDLYRHDASDPDSLPDDQVMSLYEDRSGLMWVGTKFGGLAKWNPRSWAFGHRLASAEEGFASSNVMAFTQDAAGRLWIGTIGGGVVVLDRRTGATQALRHDARNPASLSDDRVMSLQAGPDGAIWAGTMGGGLNRVDPISLHAVAYTNDPKDARSLGADGVMSLLVDSAGVLWVGTYGGGLSRYDRTTNGFSTFSADAADPSRLESGRVTALAEDANQRIWVGTDGGGLHILDPASGRIFRLPHEEGDLTALSAHTVYAIHVDRSGTVWVGTRGGGLDRATGSSLEPQEIRFRNFSERDGLPNNTIYGIRSDPAGALWLSTNRGLARFDPRTGAVRAFHRSQGLQGEEYNFGAHFANADGELFFGGPNGYNSFIPAQLDFTAPPAPVVVTALSRLGQPLAGPLRLDGSDGSITFEFAALDFTEPRENRFQYRLKGLDTAWSPPRRERNVTFTNLEGGRYALQVRAANADGVWSERSLDVPFEVTPPPWKSGTAYVAYAFALAIVGWLAWFAHRRSIIREVRYSQKLEAEVRRRTLELEQVSFSDALTGLGNRRALIDAMPGVIAEAQGRRVALMIMDLDNLKPINDEHGHEGGDRVLSGVGAMLRDALQPGDRLVRWGGDEFVFVRAGTGLDEAAAFAEQVRSAIESSSFALADGRSTRTTCSIGFALYPFLPAAPRAMSWEQVLHLADLALYRAKAGRNGWFGWSGKRAASAMPDLTAFLAAQTGSVVENTYVDSRSSAAERAADQAFARSINWSGRA